MFPKPTVQFLNWTLRPEDMGQGRRESLNDTYATFNPQIMALNLTYRDRHPALTVLSLGAWWAGLSAFLEDHVWLCYSFQRN